MMSDEFTQEFFGNPDNINLLPAEIHIFVAQEEIYRMWELKRKLQEYLKGYRRPDFIKCLGDKE